MEKREFAVVGFNASTVVGDGDVTVDSSDAPASQDVTPSAWPVAQDPDTRLVEPRPMRGWFRERAYEPPWLLLVLPSGLALPLPDPSAAR